MKTLCLTHQDFDGVASAALACRYVHAKDPDAETNVVFVNHDAIGDLLKVKPEEYGMVFITDIISVAAYHKFKNVPNVYIFDHHIKRELGEIDTERAYIGTKLGCAAEIVYDRLIKPEEAICESMKASLKTFSEMAGVVDLFKRDDPRFGEAQCMSSLCYLWEEERDFSLMYACNRFYYQPELNPMSEMEKGMLARKAKMRDNEFREMERTELYYKVLKIRKKGRFMGMGWLTDKLLYEEEYWWFAAVSEHDGKWFISIRSRDDDVDFGAIVAELKPGSGGHPKACGMVCDSEEEAEGYVKKIFEKWFRLGYDVYYEDWVKD